MSNRSKSSRDWERDDRDRDYRDRERERRDREERRDEREDRRDRGDREKERDRKKDTKDRSEKRKREEEPRRDSKERDAKAEKAEKDEKEAPKKAKMSAEEERLLLAIAEKKKQSERLARVQAWKQIAGTETGASEPESKSHQAKEATLVTKPAIAPKGKLKAVGLFAGEETTTEKKHLSKLDDALQNAQEGDRALLLHQNNDKPSEVAMEMEEGAEARPEEEEDELDDEDEIERERTTRLLKEQEVGGEESTLHMDVDQPLSPEIKRSEEMTRGEEETMGEKQMDVEPLKKEVTSTRNKVAAWKGVNTTKRSSKKSIPMPEIGLTGDEDPLAIYMRTISADFRKETESAMAKAKEEAAQRDTVEIDEEEEDREAVIVKKKLIEAIDHRKQVRFIFQVYFLIFFLSFVVFFSFLFLFIVLVIPHISSL
jgi:hypothetical protein